LASSNKKYLPSINEKYLSSINEKYLNISCATCIKRSERCSTEKYLPSISEKYLTSINEKYLPPNFSYVDFLCHMHKEIRAMLN